MESREIHRRRFLRPPKRGRYDLARARAGAGDRTKALLHLTQAAEAGPCDAARVEADALFKKLLNETAFQAALGKIGGNPPELAGRGRIC